MHYMTSGLKWLKKWVRMICPGEVPCKAAIPYSRTKNRPFSRIKKDEVSFIPQAGVYDSSLEAYERKDWRGEFVSMLCGRGIEIGPLHRPMLTHDGMQMDYVDRCTVDELRKHYPELSEQPLVEPTIISDAEKMQGIAEENWDFLIAAHVIEHMKNPLGSLESWLKVVKPNGLIYLVVPDKRSIFDRKRVRTTLEHLIADYRKPSAERDWEHYLDYAIHVHELKREKAIEDANRLVSEDYSIHFHVFLPKDILDLIEWFSDNIKPVNILKGPCMSPGSDEFHIMLKKRLQ